MNINLRCEKGDEGYKLRRRKWPKSTTKRYVSAPYGHGRVQRHGGHGDALAHVSMPGEDLLEGHAHQSQRRGRGGIRELVPDDGEGDQDLPDEEAAQEERDRAAEVVKAQDEPVVVAACVAVEAAGEFAERATLPQGAKQTL